MRRRRRRFATRVRRVGVGGVAVRGGTIRGGHFRMERLPAFHQLRERSFPVRVQTRGPFGAFAKTDRQSKQNGPVVWVQAHRVWQNRRVVGVDLREGYEPGVFVHPVTASGWWCRPIA